MMIIAGIIAAMLTLGAGVFATIALCGWVLEYLTSGPRTRAWWSTPAWVAFGLCVAIPMFIGSFLLAAAVGISVSGISP